MSILATMAKLVPFTVRHRGKDRLISTLREAQRIAEALLEDERFDGDTELIGVSTLIAQAMAGHSTPFAAFRAFGRFANKTGLTVPKEKSAAWEEFATKAGLML